MSSGAICMACAAALVSAKAAAREGREADACGGEKDMAGWMDGFVRIEKMEMMLWWALEFPHEAKSTGLAERNQFSSGGTRWPSPFGGSSPSQGTAHHRLLTYRLTSYWWAAARGGDSSIIDIHISFGSAAAATRRRRWRPRIASDDHQH